MSEKIAPEVAEQEIADACDLLGSSLDGTQREIVKKAWTEGRIIFDAGKETFTYRLRSPVERGEKKYTDITIREPTAGQLQEAMRGKADEMESTIKMLQKVSGEPTLVIEDIKQRDIAVLGCLLGFFN